MRQGDSISPILFKLALEPFLFSLLNLSTIRGYSPSLRPISSTLSLVSPRPVKFLAYADGVLLFINCQREFLELQEKLLIYSSAFNSQINCHKPVAFLLSGRILRDISFRNYIVQDQNINWINVHPLSI